MTMKRSSPLPGIALADLKVDFCLVLSFGISRVRMPVHALRQLRLDCRLDPVTGGCDQTPTPEHLHQIVPGGCDQWDGNMGCAAQRCGTAGFFFSFLHVRLSRSLLLYVFVFFQKMLVKSSQLHQPYSPPPPQHYREIEALTLAGICFPASFKRDQGDTQGLGWKEREEREQREREEREREERNVTIPPPNEGWGAGVLQEGASFHTESRGRAAVV